MTHTNNNIVKKFSELIKVFSNRELVLTMDKGLQRMDMQERIEVEKHK